MSGIAIRRRKPALEIEIVFKIMTVGIIGRSEIRFSAEAGEDQAMMTTC